MASGGMDTYLVCPTCRQTGLQVLSTSAVIRSMEILAELFDSSANSVRPSVFSLPWACHPAQFPSKYWTRCAESQRDPPADQSTN